MASLTVMVMMVAVTVMVAEAQFTPDAPLTTFAPVTTNAPVTADTLAIIVYKFNLPRPPGASFSDACEPYPTDTTYSPPIVTTVARPTTSAPSSALGIGVGVGVGAGVLLILVITLSVCYCKRRNEPHALQKPQNTSATEDPSRYIPNPATRGQLPVPDELPGIKFQREAMKDNEDEIYEELDDEGRAQKKEPHYLNFKAPVQHSTSPYECPDSQLDSATTKPGVDSPYVDLTIQ
ncbi:uncharacterized protein LOC133359652 isoform X2 [Lethenteron reissneri]|uniref:uncharacterized protein LOC133359652 isoform X2 n=1 Tax=Lethenteron reissneri TaxID=7753 RepID=UPI002AB6EE41|nr:uncharacterized protein LOC133359652 isoform X2 [Lethenteron reissneri]